MSVLIKGMEMPEVCADCPFRSTPELFMLEANRYQYISRCTRADEEIEDPWRDILWQHKHKESWCPIGDVPTPHGRLGDLDRLYKHIKAECNIYGKPTIGFEDGNKVLKIIADTRTVIEAEEGEG